MTISGENLAKKYYKQWVIKGFTHSFLPDKITGIQGRNGSGKSTLLGLLSSVISPTEGTVSYRTENGIIPIEEARLKLLMVSPSLHLPQQMTVSETINFHFQFRTYLPEFHQKRFLQETQLKHARHLRVQELSSGMKQRLKLGLVFFSNGDFLLLDEPTSNLDTKGIQWVSHLIETYRENRGMIIASNEQRDFAFCDKTLSVSNYK